ncbi:MAG: PDZ domain-containing protein [Myxococcota bacterium]
MSQERNRLQSAISRNTGRAAIGVLLLVLGLFACNRTLIDSYPDTFAGVGLVLRVVDSWPVVEKAINGGTAAGAGIEPGDLIERIDGLPTEGMTLGSVVSKIRGEEGSQVTLAIRRDEQRLIVVVPRRKMVKSDDDRVYHTSTAKSD